MTSFGNVYGVEWDCLHNALGTETGRYTRSTNCTLSGGNHCPVSSYLEINGTRTDMNNLVTITALPNKRHFYLNNANAELTLRYIKLSGGSVTGSSGGAIQIYTSGGKLNLYWCVLSNNKAYYGGGAIHATNAAINIFNSIFTDNDGQSSYGGAIMMTTSSSIIKNTTIAGNKVSYGGGGIYIEYSDVSLSKLVISDNEAWAHGGGIYIKGTTYNGQGPSNVNISETLLSNNKVASSASGAGSSGGGGLALASHVNVNIREVSFVGNVANNNLGHEIFIVGTSTMIPKIAIVNTHFNDTTDNNNFYEHQTGATWKSCSENLCTETPFTGPCATIGTKEFGVLCNLKCPNSYFSATTAVSVALSAPSDTCKPWQKCSAGFKQVNGNATSDAKCVQCDQGQFQSVNDFDGSSCQVWATITCNAGFKFVQGNATMDGRCLNCGPGQFQPLNQFNGTTCTNWKTCNSNEYAAFNGNSTSDRVCLIKPTTTTVAPTTTTGAAPTTTTTVAPPPPTTTTGAAPTTTTLSPSVSSTTGATTTMATTTVASMNGNTTTVSSYVALRTSPPTSTNNDIAVTTPAAAAETVTTTKSSGRSRSTNNLNEKEEGELSSSSRNSWSTVSTIIIFMTLISCQL
jgi:hypothetical protein